MSRDATPPDAAGTPVVAGIGVATGFGYGKDALRAGLFAPSDRFGVLARPGRRIPETGETFIGVELPEPPEVLPKRVVRTTGLTGRVAAAVLDEAWREAGLDSVDPERIGLIVGGSNLQSREHLLTQQAYAGERMAYLPPRYGHMLFDTDLCGLCASVFAIRGFAHTVGGASASGALAVLHAAEAVRAGRVDACIALGALQDLSHVELRALRTLGAMGSDRYAAEPGRACRPFDRGRDGFVFGESAAALVIRRDDGATPHYGHIVGGAQVADGNRGPEPSPDGEACAIRRALASAGLRPDDIDCISAHGTGTPAGDDAEAAAIRAAGLTHARINATKSLIGHGLAAAGAVETAALLVQMRDGRLHATRNLEDPIDPGLRWVAGQAEPHAFRNALKLSFGFGGIDVALVLRAPDPV